MKLRKTLLPLTLFMSPFLLNGGQAQAQYKPYTPAASYSSSSSKENTMGLKGDLSFLSYAGTATNAFTLEGFFGWNKDTWEAGPKLTILTRSQSGLSVSMFGIGGYGDYNFKNSSDLAIGITGSLMLGSVNGIVSINGTNSSITGSSSGSYNEIALGGVLKWFILRSASTAFRFELLYDNISVPSTSINGIVLRYGMQTYF